jgi:hypothetical protein
MRRPAAVPAFIQRAIYRSERERRANILARPMRAMFDLLASGEVLEIDGHAVMHMPKYANQDAEYCAIAPAMRGWIDLWAHVAPVDTYHIGVLADRIEQDKPITPRLVEQAREQFEACIKMIPDMPPGKIESAITTTQIKWALEDVV